MKYDVVLLDLDGTLMDSGEGIMRCAQYALGKMGVMVDDWRTLRRFVGPPLEDSFIEFYGFDAAKAHDAVMAYRERYFTKGRMEQTPYPGTDAFLRRLRATGCTVCLATSKMMTQSQFVVETFGLSQYIDYIFARDDAGMIHTKADVIRSALETLSVRNLDKVLMVGDRKFDIIGAKECGIASAGVLYGYGDLEELREAGATYICKNFDEIISLCLD